MKDQLRTGEIDSVNPQTRQSDRQADKTKRERRGEGGASPKTAAQTAAPAVYRRHCMGCVHLSIWTFHLRFSIQVYLRCIHPLLRGKKRGKKKSAESDYNHTAIVCNKQASWCFCGGGIQVLVHFKVKRIPE